MNPVEFPERNMYFGPPKGMSESQVKPIAAHITEAKQGSVDGAPVIVVAWKPSPEDLERLNKEGLIYLSVIGGLPPHFLTTSFQEAINPA